jgi:RNA binding exosome subunit
MLHASIEKETLKKQIELKMQFHNKRDTQQLIESKWRVDSGDEVIIKRA